MSADIATHERVWDAHTAAEFVSGDIDATMATKFNALLPKDRATER